MMGVTAPFARGQWSRDAQPRDGLARPEPLARLRQHAHQAPGERAAHLGAHARTLDARRSTAREPRARRRCVSISADSQRNTPAEGATTIRSGTDIRSPWINMVSVMRAPCAARAFLVQWGRVRRATGGLFVGGERGLRLHGGTAWLHQNPEVFRQCLASVHYSRVTTRHYSLVIERDTLPVLTRATPTIFRGEPMIERVVEQWHAYVRGEAPDALDELLADDVVFYSPIVYTPQEGKALTTLTCRRPARPFPAKPTRRSPTAATIAGAVPLDEDRACPTTPRCSNSRRPSTGSTSTASTSSAAMARARSWSSA